MENCRFIRSLSRIGRGAAVAITTGEYEDSNIKKKKANLTATKEGIKMAFLLHLGDG